MARKPRLGYAVGGEDTRQLHAALSELACGEATPVRNMLQLQLLELFALGVEVNAIHITLDLVKGDVVESLEARSRDGPHSVVGDQKVLLPPHEDGVLLGNVVDVYGSSTGGFLVGAEGVKLRPVAKVHLVAGSPVLMLGEETVLGTDDFTLKICCERGMVFGQALDAQITAKE